MENVEHPQMFSWSWSTNSSIQTGNTSRISVRNCYRYLTEHITSSSVSQTRHFNFSVAAVAVTIGHRTHLMINLLLSVLPQTTMTTMFHFKTYNLFITSPLNEPKAVDKVTFLTESSMCFIFSQPNSFLRAVC